MKYIFLIFSIFFTLTSNAQLPQPGEHLYFPNMDNFVGTWKWTSGADEVTIKLKKIHFFNSSGQFYADWIMGSHCYIKNGIMVESKLSEFPGIGQYSLSSIGLWYWADYNTPNKLTGQLKDPLKNKTDRLYLEYIAGTVPTLRLELSSLPGAVAVYPGHPAPPQGVTLPEDIILVKQP